MRRSYVFAILFLIVSPAISVPLLNQAIVVQGQPYNIEMTWTDNNETTIFYFLNYSTQLTITSYEESFYGNLTIECSKHIICEQQEYQNLPINKNATLTFNITYNIGFGGKSEYLQATLENISIYGYHKDSYFQPVDYRTPIVVPIETRFGYPFKNPPVISYSTLDYTTRIADGQDIELTLSVRNVLPNINLSGFIGVYIDYDPGEFGAKNPHIAKAKEKVELPPGSSKELKIVLEYPKNATYRFYDELIDLNVCPIFSLTSDFSAYQYLKALEGKMWMQPSGLLKVQSKVKVQVVPVSLADKWTADPWKGVKMRVTVENDNKEPLKDIDVIIMDEVTESYAPGFKRYGNETTLHVGDVDLLDSRSVNWTFIPKTSGSHDLTVYIKGRKDVKGGYKITFESGLNLTYYSKGSRLKCDSRGICREYYRMPVTVDEPMEFSIQTNNSRGYVGRFEVTTLYYEGIGLTTGEDRLTRDGWLDQHSLVDVQFSQDQLGPGLQNHSFRVVPRMTGVLEIIPFAEVGEKVLFFDSNTGKQKPELSDACNHRYTSISVDNMNSAHPYAFICVQSKETNKRTYMYSITLSIIIIASVLLTMYYSMIKKRKAITRRWKHQERHPPAQEPDGLNH